MDNYRAFLAIIISFLILVGYQYLFVGFGPKEGEQQTTNQQVEVTAGGETEKTASAEETAPAANDTSSFAPVKTEGFAPVAGDREAKKTVVETPLFTAVFSEAGGAVESFVLKKYKETNEEGSPGKQLLPGAETNHGSLAFSWGDIVPENLYYTVAADEVAFRDGKGELRYVARTPSGISVEKIYTFSEDSYLVDLDVHVTNSSGQTLQGNAVVHQINRPFQSNNSFNKFIFQGAAAYGGEELTQVKAKELSEGPVTIPGIFDWVGFESTYFMCALIPEDKEQANFYADGDESIVATQLAAGIDTLAPGVVTSYGYHVYYGPKKYSLLKKIGYKLEESIDFGWFAIIARPTLALLNFFHTYLKNYGIAIILVTIIFKLLFWPITQRGLKSMKNMQKLQPKMVKIKEKYKNDPQTMNREVMNLYKTYKVNPLGGCLPMLLQIPVFFALYKVLLICIELRHAPFMLWITDLSAPDRLWIGFDIPWLGGVPVLTLLMGASMFLQQKMSPTTADPTQARIMMMLPVVFTFMFLNFASGLVLYWFVNNLLSILQQQLINRSAAQKGK